MNTDTLDIVMPFLKDMIIRETNVNNVISAVNKNFHREFKDVKIIISLFHWSNDEMSSDFFFKYSTFILKLGVLIDATWAIRPD